jgi:hypothetical protein
VLKKGFRRRALGRGLRMMCGVEGGRVRWL